MSECAQSHGPCPYELLIAFVTFASRADAVPQESLWGREVVPKGTPGFESHLYPFLAVILGKSLTSLSLKTPSTEWSKGQGLLLGAPGRWRETHLLGPCQHSLWVWLSLSDSSWEQFVILHPEVRESGILQAVLQEAARILRPWEGEVALVTWHFQFSVGRVCSPVLPIK